MAHVGIFIEDQEVGDAFVVITDSDIGAEPWNVHPLQDQPELVRRCRATFMLYLFITRRWSL